MVSTLELIKKGESKMLELKEIFPSNDKIAKTLVAFANTSGGKLIIGVSDSGEIIGIGDIDIFDWQDKISSILHDSCHPNIMPDYFTETIYGKLLFVVEVGRGNLLPYYLKTKGKENGTFIRVGATNRKASLENIAELERQRYNISFDEEIDYTRGTKRLDYKFLKHEFKLVNKTIGKEKLLNLKLIKQDGKTTKATNAFSILDGSFEHCVIKCSRFKGTDVTLFIDRKEFNGNIFSQLIEAENFIKTHINLRGEIKGLRREDTLEIPERAIREALVNALVHRDYTNFGRDIKISIFDDRVTIISPGGFPNKLQIDEVLQGRSEVRNRTLARVFKELNLIEQWGTGIKRIFSSCESHGLKTPSIIETANYVEFTFYRNESATTKYRNETTNTPKKTVKTVNLSKKSKNSEIENIDKTVNSIITYLKNNKSLTKRKLKDLVTVKDTKAKRILNSLLEKGIIERKGVGRGTYYILKN